MEYKQVILIRADLKLPKGKIAAQAAHASVDGVLKQLSAAGGKEIVKAWRLAGMKKIALRVADEKELYKYVQQAKDVNLITAVITDAGKTVVAPGTVTCAVIGPNEEEKINTITKDIPLL
ncbi:peptidyl-tRNA hydrolase Pth2 [Candidatus Woesearchaeota archaeon]|nr:peptidyl-tRNA hydrolase Pth2 [Candidatus Woesearchaeota archaeon]